MNSSYFLGYANSNETMLLGAQLKVQCVVPFQQMLVSNSDNSVLAGLLRA